MTVQRAGSAVDYRITWLEMTARPGFGWPRQPLGINGALVRADAPPVWYFLALYDAVGRDYAWEDMHSLDEVELAAWLSHPDVALWTFMAQGWPQGFFLLDVQAPGVTELAYFGLVPQAIGRGLGTFLLRTAILTAWDRPGLEKLTVNTCSLDHPRALAGYQKHGFGVVAQETRRRVLTRDRDLSRIPD
jgi:GNAT superfamily N-acetyltransferase